MNEPTTFHSQSPTPPEIVNRFADLHPPFTPQAAVAEAHRCLYCFDAPCIGACPTHIDVPKCIKKIATGNLEGSARTILDANILGASCSRACPVDVLCEGACVMHRYNKQPIEIGRLQRFAMDALHASGAPLPFTPGPDTGKRVALIGAGPASLACAAELRRRGIAADIYDARPLPGGLNTYGVAEYKLRTADSLREVELIRGLGVTFETRDVDPAGLAALEREFDAVFLGAGLGAMHSLAVDGGASAGVVDALELIAGYKTGARLEVPARVVVIGAGNTAIDAACAARKLGAQTVTIVYRRQREDISAFDFEYVHALHEGIEFVWATLPIAVTSAAAGLTLECVRVAADPARLLVPVPGSELAIPCDMVIPAIGQSPLLDLLSQVPGLHMHQGRVVIDRATGQTTNPRYFAGGDCVNGGREVVDAVADGKRAAIGIAASLTVREAHHG
jgi:dihydropyrimidine dehydrogenase (NAD+) subunit PreT